MSLQFITDSNGKTTAVVVPINQWNKLKDKYTEIDSESIDIPQWQMDETSKRLKHLDENPDSAIDFDKAMDDLEKKYDL